MSNQKSKKPVSTNEELKQETHHKEAVQKGYNEKNPKQSQGAFFPDSRSADKKEKK